MKLTKKILTITFFMALITGIASADSFIDADAIAMLENWGSQKEKESIVEPAGYGKPDTKKQAADQRNTFFTKDVWEMLANWNNSKRIESNMLPEGYGKPEAKREAKVDQRNTLFPEDVWIMLENW